MKIEFKNSSKIESVYSSNTTRGKMKYFYIECFHLKWWQKIYLKIYGWVVELFWPYIRNRYRR